MCLKKIRLSKNTSKANASELEQDLQELENNYQMLRMRKYAKLILIGFFIGRDTKNKINELKAKIEDKIRVKISQTSKFVQENMASGAYLIYPKKSLCLSSIVSARLQLTQCEKCAVFSTKFIGSNAPNSLQKRTVN